MKKIAIVSQVLSLFVAVLLTASLVHAVQEKVTTERPSTVAGILEKPVSGTPVTLRGKIVGDLGSSYYRFKDETGEIKVKITPEVMVDKSLEKDATVEISGLLVTPKAPGGPQINVGLLTVTSTFLEEVPTEAREIPSTQIPTSQPPPTKEVK